MIDGAVARKTNTVSELGSKLDTILVSEFYTAGILWYVMKTGIIKMPQ